MKKGRRPPETAKAQAGPKEALPPHIPGYPTLTIEATGRLLVLVANGRGVKRGCEEVGICRQTFYEALRDHKPLADNYTRARELEADLDADDVKEIADDDELEPDEKKIRIDARKWSAGVRRPKLYGAKVEVTEVSDPLTPDGMRARKDQLLQRLDELRERLAPR